MSETNVEQCAAANIEPLIALGRCPHHLSWKQRFAAAPKTTRLGHGAGEDGVSIAHATR
jgi:hypothetical protein